MSAAPRQRLARGAFYGHLWLGVLFTVVLTVISLTGIALNHKRGLGLMPDVPHEPTAPFAAALSLDSLGAIALAAAPAAGAANGGPTSARADATAADAPAADAAAADRRASSIDRMDVRPRDGYVKVRLRDPASTEVTVDLASGRVLHVGARGDVFLERLHSGEALGDGWVLLSDAGAVALVVLLATGYWLWLAPKRPR